VPSKKAEEERSFEQMLADVEEVVRTLQEGGTTLDEALALYEKGFRAVQGAQQRLAAAREKLEVLQKDALADDEAAD
jgi:exodeoxyribonuclease VII small subunit